MKKLTVLIAFFLASILLGQTGVKPSGDGSSTPYQISTWQNLYWVSQNSDSWSKDFLQTANITFPTTGEDDDIHGWDNNKGWTPIAGGGTADKFTGTYDGGGNKITNLVIDRTSTANVGLFGHIGEDAVIKNLGLDGVDVKGARGTGSLVGRVTGDETTYIEYCYASNGTVVGDGATGGLVGSNNSYSASPSNRNEHPTIQYCWADIDVSWSGNGNGDKIAGLSGCNQKGKIYDSYAHGSVTVDNDPQVDSVIPERIAGLAGCILYRGYIENSYSTGLVTTKGSVSDVGGFLGKGGDGGSAGNVYDCFFDLLDSGGSATNPSTSATAYEPTGVTGESTSNMQTESTFTNAGWDFNNIWTCNSYPTLKVTPPASIQDITFTDGSGYSVPSITRGSNDDQPIGRFSLSAGGSGSYLERATIHLVGTNSGASTFKLWASADGTFDSGDTQLGSSDEPTAISDDSCYVSFAFNNEISTGTEYYFLTCRVASNASGTIRGRLQDNSALTIYGGTLNSTISDASLSGGDASLPVELASFIAKCQEDKISLQWITESEIANLGFVLERRHAPESGYQQEWQEIASYRTDPELCGQGSTPDRTVYSYTDINVVGGTAYEYRLGDVSRRGNVTWHEPVEVVLPVGAGQIPDEFGLRRAYPNPFNPNVTLTYGLTEDTHTVLEVYNLRGQHVTTLVNEDQRAGRYTLTWKAEGLSSGMYIIHLQSGNQFSQQKAVYIE